MVIVYLEIFTKLSRACLLEVPCPNPSFQIKANELSEHDVKFDESCRDAAPGFAMRRVFTIQS